MWYGRPAPALWIGSSAALPTLWWGARNDQSSPIWVCLGTQRLGLSQLDSFRFRLFLLVVACASSVWPGEEGPGNFNYLDMPVPVETEEHGGLEYFKREEDRGGCSSRGDGVRRSCLVALSSVERMCLGRSGRSGETRGNCNLTQICPRVCNCSKVFLFSDDDTPVWVYSTRKKEKNLVNLSQSPSIHTDVHSAEQGLKE